MNGDPYRSPQPTDRRVINRSSQPPAAPSSAESAAYVPREEPVAQPAVSRSTPTSLQSKAPTTRSRTPVWIAIIVVTVLILAGISWIILSRAQPVVTGINTSRYQAVYLANGQIYFGKLETLGSSKMRLTNVYYLQTKTDTASTDTKDQSTNGNFQLIKLRGAVYGPSDEMIISNDQIIYFQNLEDNSKAAELIKSDR